MNRVVLIVCSTFVVFAINGHVHDRLNKERVEDSHFKDGEHNADFDHESILGSKYKVDEYNDLSPEEAQRRLAILVTEKGMDADKDGYVDKAELTRWVQESFKMLAEESGIERLKEEDANGDGLVSWDEHMNDSFPSDEMDVEEDEMIREDKALWASADRNGDGLLNATEFAAFNSPEEFEHMFNVLYEILMSKRDKNRDRFLTFQEFLDDDELFKDKKSEQLVVEQDKFNHEYDVDRNGLLDKKEVMRWLIPDNSELAITEADHLITSCDGDGDGRLSLKEIVSNHEVFVGSETTDFGERLRNMKDEL